MAAIGQDRWPQPRKEKVLSRQDVEGLIAQGQRIFIVDRNVLKVDAWLKYHPGGEKAIMHMVGRDATDEVNALHSSEARQRMSSFRIGRIQGQWKNFLPPIQGGQFRSNDEMDKFEDVEIVEAASPSERSSIPGSPVFDYSEMSDDSFRQRRGERHENGYSSSISSVSSIDLDPQDTNKMSYMDAYTQHEIDLDIDKYPSLDADTQTDIVQKYRALHDRIRNEGLFECSYRSYFIELCRYTLLFSTFLFLLHHSYYLTSSLFLGAFWHQLAFTAHDAGHMGITHSFHTDTAIGIITSDFLGGLSLGWWKHNHNVHHIVTNSPEHDPDIEHMPFFAISHRFFASLRSSYYERIMHYDLFARFVVRYQQYLYYPILTLGRFNLYRLSWAYLLLGQGPKRGPAWWHRWFEIAGQAFFWTWFGYGVVYRCIPSAGARLAFVLLSHMVTAPLHVQITLSHFAMSTADLGVDESFPQKMLRTTMDVDCPAWLDFVHGGLQFQAIHHLFPRIPRHNLRRTQTLVQGFCKEAGIPYALYGFVDGSREVIGRLGEVGRQAAILARCQSVMAERGDFGGH
ncbi:hypothetical protein MMC34_000734 [Xylographa carneopallida]|nr:hypothetical protein [Xylographa carneopallida]